jgi:hypothetical protein
MSILLQFRFSFFFFLIYSKELTVTLANVRQSSILGYWLCGMQSLKQCKPVSRLKRPQIYINLQNLSAGVQHENSSA